MFARLVGAFPVLFSTFMRNQVAKINSLRLIYTYSNVLHHSVLVF